MRRQIATSGLTEPISALSFCPCVISIFPFCTFYSLCTLEKLTYRYAGTLCDRRACTDGNLKQIFRRVRHFLRMLTCIRTHAGMYAHARKTQTCLHIQSTHKYAQRLPRSSEFMSTGDLYILESMWPIENGPIKLFG